MSGVCPSSRSEPSAGLTTDGAGASSVVATGLSSVSEAAGRKIAGGAVSSATGACGAAWRGCAGSRSELMIGTAAVRIFSCARAWRRVRPDTPNSAPASAKGESKTAGRRAGVAGSSAGAGTEASSSAEASSTGVFSTEGSSAGVPTAPSSTTSPAESAVDSSPAEPLAASSPAAAGTASMTSAGAEVSASGACSPSGCGGMIGVAPV